MELREAIGALESNLTMDITSRRRWEIDSLCEQYSRLDFVPKELQKYATSCADVRALFDKVIEGFPNSCGTLSQSNNIIQDPVLESVIVKTQNKSASTLTSRKYPN